MDITIFIILLLGLQAVCFVVGKYSSEGQTTQNDYFLASKGVRFLPLMMTFLATQVGGGLVLGSAEEAYQFGWAVIFYPLGAALGLLLLSFGIGRRLADLRIATVAQIFELVYASPFLKKVASLLSMATLFMIFIAQIVGSHKFMLSLGIDNDFLFIGFWAVVILYTSLGGLKAVVATDIVQASFFMAIFVFAFGYIAYTAPVCIWQVASEGFAETSFSFSASKLCGWLLMPLLFMVIEQDMGQRCFAAESPEAVSKATLWAAVGTLLMGAIPVMWGVMAKTSGLIVPPGTSVLMLTIMQTTTPFIAALVGCAILAAIISTADSLINAIGSNLAQDFEIPFLQQDNIRAAQLLSAAISILGIGLSFFFTNIVDLLILSYEISVSCLFVPIFIGIFRKQAHSLTALLAIACGGISFAIFSFISAPIPKEILNILFSLAGYGLGYWLTEAVWQKACEKAELNTL